MTAVEAEMRATLAALTKEGVWGYAKAPSRPQWVLASLGMVTLAGSQVWWTWQTEDALRRARTGGGGGGEKHAVKAHAAQLTAQLGELTAMVRGDED